MYVNVNPCLFCNSEEATSVMVELLRTYTDENASEVKDDAKNCIVSLMGRPYETEEYKSKVSMF